MRREHRNLAYSPDSAPWLDDGESGYFGTVAPHTIREVAKTYRVTERALRFYETKGLLQPQREGCCRRYGAEELNRLAMLLKAKSLGFTLAEIRQMFASPSAGGALDISRRQCVEQIKLLEGRKRGIEAALAELRRTYSAMYVGLARRGG